MTTTIGLSPVVVVEDDVKVHQLHPRHQQSSNNNDNNMNTLLSSSFWMDSVCGQNESMQNDLFVVRPACKVVTSLLVFFPGDVQDREEFMLCRDHDDFVQYSLERTGMMLSHKFPNHLVICVRPCKKLNGFVSVFENFVVQFDNFSNFSYYSSKDMAVRHLMFLITNCLSRLGDVHIDSVEAVDLLGFSRGGVVLNQIVEECVNCQHHLWFWTRLRRIIWIDSGNSPATGAYPSRKSIASLCSVLKDCGEQCSLHIFGTPYQLENPSRTYNRLEVSEMLQAIANSNYSRYSFELMFPDSPPDIHMHFSALWDFALHQ
eukprot:TRINITY_DN4660_c0_g1_i1.p1 TRINITY_DN4660_c0_g1~~TRINITY_DN4660_c0_g1_i1.p1  ORF type:complete len:317 (-),score=48.33 TRINITY_DN4660_c0_g1_i1:15-965(-)